MNRRAVFATEFWFGANGRSLAQGFREQGWAVDEVDVHHYAPRGRSLAARAAGRLLGPLQRREYNRAILQSAIDHDAAVMLTVKGGEIDVATLDALRARGVRTVNYYPDFEFEYAGFDRERLRGYDLVATTKSFHLEPLRTMIGADRVALVHHGFSPLAHRAVAVPDSDAGFERDIVYIGNASPYKRDWLLPLFEAPALAHARKFVIGHRWSDVAAGTAIAPHVLGRAMAGDFYSREIGVSKINIALHMGPATASGWQDLVSTRTFEIPAAGGFMLHIDNAEVRGLFDHGKEFDSFASPEQLVERVVHYLAHPAERMAMAQAGHTRAWRDHSMDARAAEIVALIERGSAAA
ncbi:CgeB family protein [Sphingomonas sp.]|jgi:hypothetical protein|uniref:CgeB family protein n=1 Tax=Sphingomonas sp. TaxID=28214 RepID=UPI002E0DBA5D|nr:glycosyltransferase [Sphingomonas sp.]